MTNPTPSRAARTSEPWITAVVVHWRNEEPLRALLRAWPEDAGAEILVVDNSRTLDDLPPPARRLDPGRNVGFGGGVGLGAAAARAPWILVLNPDVIPADGALERLRRTVSETAAAGVVPALRNADGTSQCRWQLRSLPSPLALVLQTLLLDTVRGPDREPGAGTPIGQPAAAALALRREVLDEVGGFDPDYFPAWFEDVDLARRLADAGHRLIYEPASRWTHGLGGSVPALGYGPFLWVYYRNLIRYLTRHHGRAWAVVARLLLPLGLKLRLLLLPLRRPKRAPSRAAAARGLLGALAGALTGFRRPAAWARRFSPPGRD